MKYGAFSDESRHTAARFRSIASVSLPASEVVAISTKLSGILTASGIREFKWVDLNGARERLGALKLVDFVFDVLLGAGGRVDVLTWDTRDSRHAVVGRDDIRNFERMYFHLHRALMERRELGAEWHLRPDERVDVDWTTIESCLGAVGRWRRHFEHPLLQEVFSERFFEVKTLKQVESSAQPLCQLADLFAGMAPYSRERSDLIRAQLLKSEGQESLFDEPALTGSRRDMERFIVIERLYRRSRGLKLGLSLRTDGFLRTRDPRAPVNFWHYSPQHSNDIAPRRDGHALAVG